MCRLLVVATTIMTFLSRPASTSTCSAPVEGTLGSNLISTINAVSDELTCKQSCLEEPSCRIYTYHRANSTYSPDTCFLLSAIASPVGECADETCLTALPDCLLSAPVCAYLDDGVLMERGVLVTEGEKSIDLLRLGECPSPVAVAVGGGGSGAFGGGGSGFVGHSALPHASYMRLMASAGGPAADSYLKDADATILTGGKGEDAGDSGDYDGGAGMN